MNRNLQILRVALWPMTKALLGLACGAVVVVGIVVLLLGCCGTAGQAIAPALEGAAVGLDVAERTEGNAVIDIAAAKGAPKVEADAELSAVRDRYRPAWVALAAALEAELAYLEDCSTLPALVAAYCSLRATGPQLKLPDLGVCP
jgi:hypothetical protein